MDLEKWLLKKAVDAEELPKANTYHISQYRTFYQYNDLDKQIYTKYFKPLVDSEEYCFKNKIYVDPTHNIRLDDGLEYYVDHENRLKKLMYIEPCSNQYYVNDLWKEVVSYCNRNNMEYTIEHLNENVNVKLFDTHMKTEFYNFCRNFSKPWIYI